MTRDEYPRTPGLWRAKAAAARAGLTYELFADACARGDIPVEILTLGKGGGKFVRAAEFAEWMRGRARPAADCADLFGETDQ